MKTRKSITLTLRVNAPAGMSAAQIRREVLTRVNQVTGHYDAFALGLPDTAENGAGYLKIRASAVSKAQRT
ncbi:hypothetical protein [EBPR siphovirus 5]|nr:hypothetical protein [EBPR siphovirus 5]